MQLSAELFSQIIESLHSDEGQSARHEKRKEGRVGVRCSIDVSPETYDDKGQRTVRVTIRDISASGVGFISHEHFDPGLCVGCRLPRQNGEWLQIRLTVRHCSKVASGLYSIGASFQTGASPLPSGNLSGEPAEANGI